MDQWFEKDKTIPDQKEIFQYKIWAPFNANGTKLWCLNIKDHWRALNLFLGEHEQSLSSTHCHSSSFFLFCDNEDDEIIGGKKCNLGMNFCGNGGNSKTKDKELEGKNTSRGIEHTYAKIRSFHDNISKKRYKELIATKDMLSWAYKKRGRLTTSRTDVGATRISSLKI